METSDMPHDGIATEGQLSVIKTDMPDGKAIAKAADRDLVDSVLDRCVQEIDQHLRQVESDVETAICEAAKMVDDECATMEATINKETEREMERIRVRREERLKEIRDKTTGRHQTIVARRKELMKQIRSLGEDIRATMEKLKTRNYGSPAAKVNANIDKLLTSSEKNGETGRFKKNVKSDHKSTSGGLVSIAEKVTAIAGNVSFVQENGTKVGRVDGAKDRWVLEDEINVAPIDYPVLKGTISKDEVVIEDSNKSIIYVTNVRDRTTKKVIKDKLQLFNCASQSGEAGVIVCGTRDGRVLLYDKSWNLVRRVTFPEKFQNSNENMCVAVDPQGNMFVARYGSNNIHVYHPSSNRWVQSIDVGEMVPIRGVHILPSGIVVHSSMYGEQACVLDLDGSQRTTVFMEESESKCLSVLATHHWVDSIYNLSCDSFSGRCTVEEFSDLNDSEGGGAKRVFDFPAPQVASGISAAQGLFFLEPDKMVTCDGDRVLVFAKKRGVEQIHKIVS